MYKTIYIFCNNFQLLNRTPSYPSSLHHDDWNIASESKRYHFPCNYQMCLSSVIIIKNHSALFFFVIFISKKFKSLLPIPTSIVYCFLLCVAKYLYFFLYLFYYYYFVIHSDGMNVKFSNNSVRKSGTYARFILITKDTTIGEMCYCSAIINRNTEEKGGFNSSDRKWFWWRISSVLIA